MELLRDWDDWQRRLGAVSRKTAAYTCNLYAAREQIEDWCAAGRLRVLSAEQAVLLLRADRDFHHVYHVAGDGPTLRAVLGVLQSGTFATDLVGRDDNLDDVCAAYAANGFTPHTYLRRMTRIGTPTWGHDGDATVALPGHAAEVAALLERLLDRFAEQVPEVAELQGHARDGRLLVVHRGDVIVGMLLYELKERTAHLRFWHVDADARGEGVGRRLMGSFFARCARAQRFVLWVIGDNERSIAIYRRYGFAVDGLLDRVMVRHEERHR